MINREDIVKLANLARMEISEEEKDSMTKDIESILSYVGQVKDISITDDKVLPLIRNIMRDDVVTNTPGFYTDKLLSVAPERKDNYFKVKKIL